MENDELLEWMFEDLYSFNPATVGEFDDDFTNHHDFDDDYCDIQLDFDDKGDKSDDSSDLSDISCSLLVGDKETVQQLNEIVNDFKKNFKGDSEDDSDDDNPEEESEDNNYGSAANIKFYIDALDVAKKLLSKVNLVWTDTLYRCIVNNASIPDSYTKTSNIEKLILFYADNFIEQFKVKYPNRRQLVLVHENECNVQKCVCTTIKPSRLVYPDLNDLTSYSEFVCNHITYIKLEDPTIVPKNITSPTTILQMQTANCFELAILLVSFLIGCGYDAYVVQGYATETVCSNDLKIVKLDLPNINDEEQAESENVDANEDDYNNLIEPMIDLSSEYVRFLMEEDKKNTVVENTVKKDVNNRYIDPLYGKRVHSWVAIIPLGIEDGNMIKSPYFVEPSTGERKEISDINYIGIEAIWNHNNYWVNLQPLDGGCAQYDFNLMNMECWEEFLPDKSQNVSTDNHENSSRRLAMPNSWVNVLEVPRNRYLMLYPSGKKIVPYMNAIKESYADYIMPDGLIEKITFYAKSDYRKKIFIKEIYKHRIDMLISIEIRFTDKEIVTTEYFISGRKDCLKEHKFSGECYNMKSNRWLKFYDFRLDSMSELKIDENSFVISYKDRSDLLFWRLCIFNRTEKTNINILNVKRKPKNIVDKYLRDESKQKDRDIATCNFDFTSDTIIVQYQYGEGQITQSIRLFHKPLVTTSDEFDPESIIENIVYPYKGYLKPYEAYTLLQDMMEAENKALFNASKLEDDFLNLLKVRNREQSEFKLKIDSLDWDRNKKIRKFLQKQKDKKFILAQREKASEIDHALPYFETVKRPLTFESAQEMRKKIINDFKHNTKCLFLQTKDLFMKKHFKLQSLIKTLEIDEFKELKLKNQVIVLCSSLKNDLDVLKLKMERYNGTRFQRYNNLVSYLNRNNDFKMLTPLIMIDYNIDLI